MILPRLIGKIKFCFWFPRDVISILIGLALSFIETKILPACLVPTCAPRKKILSNVFHAFSHFSHQIKLRLQPTSFKATMLWPQKENWAKSPLPNRDRPSSLTSNNYKCSNVFSKLRILPSNSKVFFINYHSSSS